jgi:hypothetical protein
VADDYRDKIEKIRTKRNRDPFGGSSLSGYDPQQALAAQRKALTNNTVINPVMPVNDTAKPNVIEGLKSPWLKDRVTLSLEGQLAMLEQRNAGGIRVADLGYTNRIPVASLRPGLFVKIEPPGTYRLVYHNR